MALVTWWWLLVAAIVAPATAQTATQISTGNYCNNRGGSAAGNRYSVLITPINLQNCANAVAANGACSNFFSYGDQGGSPDGYCDCVPCGGTSCTAAAHGSYATYSIETSYQACTQLASTSVALTSTDLNSGTTPSQIVFSATTVQALSATHTVTITASANIWSAATSVTCTVSQGGSPGAETTTFAGGLSASSQAIFVATVASAQSVGAGVALVFTCTSNLAALGTSGTVVTFTFESYQDVTQVTGVTGWTVNPTPTPTPTPGVVSGDPVTWFGNRRAEFELPLNQLTQLLELPDLQVLAAPFLGSSGEQWIGRVLVQDRSTLETLVHIDVHRDLMDFDRKVLTNEGREDFETMSVLINKKACSELHQMQFKCADGIWGLISKIDCKFERHLPCRETVVVTSKVMKIAITSSPAREYYGLTQEAFRHVHLDIDAFDMPSEKHLIQGALPEMWGLHPISPQTRKLLTKGDPIDVSVSNQTETCNDTW
eukprot:TRINITY_DN7011_c0_g1_i1.p1 TRINITY_DN7011_c0_g1~~TRINITY_DN7011_c0_g1_i1.p1  ORF type:complete len:487 (+),score=49.23 TRINITY_DN7011_c0_g1_i1:47-1507(+)